MPARARMRARGVFMDESESSKSRSVDRRDFLKIGGGLTAGFLARGVVDAKASAREMPPLPEKLKPP